MPRAGDGVVDARLLQLQRHVGRGEAEGGFLLGRLPLAGDSSALLRAIHSPYLFLVKRIRASYYSLIATGELNAHLEYC